MCERGVGWQQVCAISGVERETKGQEQLSIKRRKISKGPLRSERQTTTRQVQSSTGSGHDQNVNMHLNEQHLYLVHLVDKLENSLRNSQG